MIPLLEIAVFNIESAMIADKAGADRVELCSGLAAGGLTPSMDDIAKAKDVLECPFFVMIRPKPGNFVYTNGQITQMKSELLEAKELGADGFVFGVMTADGSIDEQINRELVALAHPLPCTFHRAFDDIEDKSSALETLISCGFQRLLTSGGIGNASDYYNVLSALNTQADGRIIIMPGGGVRTNNLKMLMRKVGAKEYHSAAIIDGGPFADTGTVWNLKEMIVTAG